LLAVAGLVPAHENVQAIYSELKQSMKRRTFLHSLAAGTVSATAPLRSQAAQPDTPGAGHHSYSERVVISGLIFPEGPSFDRAGNFYVGDLDTGRVHRVTPDGTASVLLDTGGGINSTKLGPDGSLWVLNGGGRTVPVYEMVPPALGGIGPKVAKSKGFPRIHRVDLRTGDTEVMFEGGPSSFPGTNDLVFDAVGNGYFTSGDSGEVWFFDNNRLLSRVASGYAYSNGLMVSDDGRALYVSETNSGVIWKHTITKPGKLGPRMGFGLMPAVTAPWRAVERDAPDSMTLDADGNVLVCGWQGGQIAVFDPRGNLIDRVRMIDQWTTNAAFGGPDFSTLYVTQSKLGRVVAIPWRTRGMTLFPLR
jgi:gluconolactonase